MKRRLTHYAAVFAGAMMGMLLGICGHFALSDWRFWALFGWSFVWASLAYVDGLKDGRSIR